MSEAGSSRPASESGDHPSKEAHKKGRFKVRSASPTSVQLAVTRSLRSDSTKPLRNSLYCMFICLEVLYSMAADQKGYMLA